MMNISPETAYENTIKFGIYFLLPGIVMFLIFFAVQSFAHIAAFTKGLTPYPAWCFIFCLPVGMAATMILKIFGDVAITNALTTAWISIGNVWQFSGLLIIIKKAKREK